MDVRTAHLADAAALGELFAQLGYPCATGEIAARLSDRANAETCRIFVASQDARVLGVVVLNVVSPVHEAGRWGIISALVVDEGHRGTGVGRQLLDRAEAHALQAGCTQLELSSGEARADAHRFYLRRGFAERRKRFFKLLEPGQALHPTAGANEPGLALTPPPTDLGSSSDATHPWAASRKSPGSKRP